MYDSLLQTFLSQTKVTELIRDTKEKLLVYNRFFSYIATIFFRPHFDHAKVVTIFTDPHISPLCRAGMSCIIQTSYLDLQFDEESVFDVFKMNRKPYDTQKTKLKLMLLQQQ